MSKHSGTIASHGKLHWYADQPDAGPYYLTWSNWHYTLASFGTRARPAVARPGSAAQREAFYQSKAAFEAIRFLVDAEDVAPEQSARSAAKLAAAAARGKWKTWNQILGNPSLFQNYLYAVIDRMTEMRK